MEMTSPSTSTRSPGMPCTTSSLTDAQMSRGTAGGRSPGTTATPPWERMFSSASAVELAGGDAGPAASRRSSSVCPTRSPAPRISGSGRRFLISSPRSSERHEPAVSSGGRVERVEDPLRDVVDLAHAVDLVDDAAPAVDADQRLGLLARRPPGGGG